MPDCLVTGFDNFTLERLMPPECMHTFPRCIEDSLRTGKLAGNCWKFRTIPASWSDFGSRSPSGLNSLWPIPCSCKNREFFLPNREFFAGTGNLSVAAAGITRHFGLRHRCFGNRTLAGPAVLRHRVRAGALS